MHKHQLSTRGFISFLTVFFLFQSLSAQMITGVWHGKMDRQKVEVKMVQNGDSLVGTSYYFESPAHYRRYSIKGYFDENDNSVVWWDDQLLEDKTKGPGLFQRKSPSASRADFNCPGGGVMMLDGKMYDDLDAQRPRGDVHLDKVTAASFHDEWDFVIDNYTVGTNDPDIIDSVASLNSTDFVAVVQVPEEKKEPAVIPKIKDPEPVKNETISPPVVRQTPKIETKIDPPSIEQKFTAREKVLTKEIPLVGDSIELKFYDNAEIDGDSISLFLNNKLIFEHIRLSDKPYTVKLSVRELAGSNELIMVAENLGAIPPNTSYMIALVGDKRYDAQLASTENSSAMIRLTKL